MQTELKTNLNGLCLLNTRPAGRAQVLSQAIEQYGGECIELPMLKIEPTPEDDKACKEQFLHFDRCRKVIFISANAVEYGVRWIGRYWPELPPNQKFFAIGEATANALKEHGISSETGIGMNSESLLSLPELFKVKGEDILIVRGAGGRETLAETLSRRGANVFYGECYTREPAVIDTETLPAQQRINCLLANSGESLKLLVNMIESAAPDYASWFKLPIIVPSSRVAGIAEDYGFEPIQAENAGISATIVALRSLYGEET